MFDDNYEEESYEDTRQKILNRNYFMEHGLQPVISYFFYQAYLALEHGLYLPACSSFLNGIETSIRITLKEIETNEMALDLNPSIILNNRLLNDALNMGLPVNLLSFSEESDFQAKITDRQPLAEIVRIRHNFCHGNILEYVNKDLGEENYFFTPECTRDVAIELLRISRLWVKALGEFRKNYFRPD